MVRPFSVLVAALVICVFAAVGFRVGRSVRVSAADTASSWDSAAAQTFSHARARAYRVAWQQAYQQGWSAGVASAATTARSAGQSAAQAQASARAVAARALAGVLATTPVRLGRGVKTEACIPVGGGLCEVLGPQVTGKRCPPDSVPYPVGGVVCVPQVLLLAARMTNATNLDVFTPWLAQTSRGG
jgi:hypothetical protein